MKNVCKVLLISLLSSSLHCDNEGIIIPDTFRYKKESFTTKGQNHDDVYKQKIEVIIPHLDEKKRTSTKFLKQILRIAIAITAVLCANEKMAGNFQEFLERHRVRFHEKLLPGYDKIIELVESGKLKLEDGNLYKYPIKGTIALAAYLATDITWDDFIDFCKLPLYLVNSVKVAAALTFYYVAFLYYKGLTPNKSVTVDNVEVIESL